MISAASIAFGNEHEFTMVLLNVHGLFQDLVLKYLVREFALVGRNRDIEPAGESSIQCFVSIEEVL